MISNIKRIKKGQIGSQVYPNYDPQTDKDGDYETGDKFYICYHTAKHHKMVEGLYEVTSDVNKQTYVLVEDDKPSGWVDDRPMNPRAVLLIKTQAVIFAGLMPHDDHIASRDQALRVAEEMLKEQGL